MRRSSNPLKLVSPANVRDMGRVPLGVTQARTIVSNARPDVVLATGGYVAVPVGLAARMCRRPLVVHEQTGSLLRPRLSRRQWPADHRQERPSRRHRGGPMAPWAGTGALVVTIHGPRMLSACAVTDTVHTRDSKWSGMRARREGQWP